MLYVFVFKLKFSPTCYLYRYHKNNKIKEFTLFHDFLTKARLCKRGPAKDMRTLYNVIHTP